MRHPFPYYRQMAVQTKSNAGDKPRQKKDINWTQIAVVAFCVLLVVMCILSFSNFSNILNGTTTSSTITAGDLVYVDYTMYIGDVPMVTSSRDVYNESPAGIIPAVTPQLVLVAGQQVDVVNSTPLLINSSTYTYPFQMWNSEYNQLATGVIGLGAGQSRTVESTGSSSQTTYTRETAEEMGIDYDNWTVGTMGILNFPVVNETSNTTTMSIRPALVTNKTADEMVLQYGYDTIEMTVVQAYRTSA